MSENKFIAQLKGNAAPGSVLEVQDKGSKTSFANMPSGTSDAIVTYSDKRNNATAVLKGAMNWKVNGSTLSVANPAGDGSDYTGQTNVAGISDQQGNNLWINASYTVPADGLFLTKNTKWVLKLCGDNLIVNGGDTAEFTVLITAGNSTNITKKFYVGEQANQFCKELVIDFAESNTSTVKLEQGDTITLKLLSDIPNASARIYQGMTTLTLLQRAVDAENVISNEGSYEEVVDDINYLENHIIVKSATMPTASADLLGEVYQYTGATAYPYEHGYIYECVQTSPDVYAWERIDVQPNGSRGRFLSLWDCTTGLAETNPAISPFEYKSGDYFIVSKVGTTNYKPTGTEYIIGQASTVVETSAVSIDDTYFFDGTNWKLQATSNDIKALVDTKVNKDGSSIMTGPLKFRAGSFEGAIAGGLGDGISVYKMNADGSINSEVAALTKTNGFIPGTTNSMNIGSSSLKWKDAYIGRVISGVLNNGADISVPTTAGTMALLSDIPTYKFDINNSGTNRNITERFNDVINVKDFGAIGDGITDDTAAIQAAINSSHHANTGIRDLIFFPSGVYKISTITISNGQSVILSNPTLVSDGTAIEIDNAFPGTIIEYANIKAKDCGIWIKRGKAVHIEHTRIDITHDTALTLTDVYGIHIGGVAGLYSGNENIISDCSIYSTNYIHSYGLYNQADDNQINNLIVYNFKYGIRDGGGANTYSQIHGWLNGYRDGTTQELEDSLKDSALFNIYRDITIQSAYADSYQYGIFCTDSSGIYQHKIDGLLIGHGDGWPSTIPINAIRAGIPYIENSFQISNLDFSNASSAPQYFCNSGSYYLHSFYANNPTNSNVSGMPYFMNALMQDVGTGYGNEARLVGVLSDRKTPTGWLGFGSWGTGAYYCRWNLNAHDTYQESHISIEQNTGYGIMSVPEVRPQADDAMNMGVAALRWKEIFCANGTINTSDERQKQNIQDIDEKVFNAWSKVEFKQFLFKSSYEKKGDNARIHIGLIAQQVKAAFESEGLDGFKYGLLCYDEWDDIFEEIEVVDEPAEYDEAGCEIKPAKTHIENKLIKAAGNTYGIRYSEALALECAYQRWLSEKLEKRLNKLENKE